MSNSIKLYNKFHKNTKSQVSIISENNFTYWYITRVLNKYLRSQYDVLDIGCGAGTICFYISNKVRSVTGVDISSKAINECHKSAKKLNLKNTEFYTMNFPEQLPKKRYDLIICFEVIEHLENDIYALNQMYKLLKPHGLLILSTPSENAPLYRLGLLKKFDNDVGHLRRYNMVQLKKIFRDNHFSVHETVKTESILRNFLYTNILAGKSIRFIRSFLTNIVIAVDKLLCSLTGESDLFIIAQKVK